MARRSGGGDHKEDSKTMYGPCDEMDTAKMWGKPEGRATLGVRIGPISPVNLSLT